MLAVDLHLDPMQNGESLFKICSNLQMDLACELMVAKCMTPAEAQQSEAEGRLQMDVTMVL